MKATGRLSPLPPWHWLGLLALLATLAGCTRDEDYLKVVREQQVAWQEVIDILRTVKDAQTMADAQKTFAQNADKYAAISRKASRLPSPPPVAVRERLQEDIGVMQALLRDMTNETTRIRGLPGGAAFLEKFKSTQGLLTAVER